MAVSAKCHYALSAAIGYLQVAGIRCMGGRIKTVTLCYNGMTFSGNDEDVILEQLEQQGIAIPYACRAGICESCKLKLLQGKVMPLKQEALCGDGGILSCSCIPAGDIVLTGPGEQEDP